MTVATPELNKEAIHETHGAACVDVAVLDCLECVFLPVADSERRAVRGKMSADRGRGFAACESACGNAYEFGSDDYQTCDNSCLYWWTEKNKHAVTCNEDSCPDCDATWICDVPDPVVDPDVNCCIFF